MLCCPHCMLGADAMLYVKHHSGTCSNPHTSSALGQFSPVKQRKHTCCTIAKLVLHVDRTSKTYVQDMGVGRTLVLPYCHLPSPLPSPLPRPLPPGPLCSSPSFVSCCMPLFCIPLCLHSSSSPEKWLHALATRAPSPPPHPPPPPPPPPLSLPPFSPFPAPPPSS